MAQLWISPQKSNLHASFVTKFSKRIEKVEKDDIIGCMKV
jgi:hypothetical protein